MAYVDTLFGHQAEVRPPARPHACTPRLFHARQPPVAACMPACPMPPAHRQPPSPPGAPPRRRC